MSLEEARARLRARVRGRPSRHGAITDARPQVAPGGSDDRARRVVDARRVSSASEEPLEPELTARLEALAALAPDAAEAIGDLDVDQRRAVLRPGSALAVRAQVGSGKTTVLTHRVLVAHVLDGIPAGRIAVLTFTRKAAEEIRGRLVATGAVAADELRLVGTFHSVARRVLEDDLPLGLIGRRPGFEILDEAGKGRRLDLIARRHGLRIAYRKRIAQRLAAFRRGRPLYGAMKRVDDIEALASLYDESRREDNLVDFDDLVDLTVQLAPHLAEDRRPLLVAVDEFQDSDARLVDFLHAFGGDAADTFVVGDPNQIIYSWRGTRADVFGSYVSRFRATELTLPRNYRSSASIVGAASGLLPGFSRIVATRGGGESVRVLRHHDSTCEAEYVAGRLDELARDGLDLDRAAVLVRLKDQLEPLRAMLDARGLSHRSGTDGESEHGVALMTLHASKGLEFDWVYLAGVNDGLLPLGRGDREHRDEEQRLFFVGLTRARDRVELGWLVRPDLPRVDSRPSPFIAALGEGAVEHVSGAAAPALDTAEPEAAAGRRVMHPVYGEGSLVSLDGDRMVCRFPKRGEKAFSRSFSRVEILD